MPTTIRSGTQLVPVGEPDGGPAAAVLDRGDARVEPEVDAVLAVQVGEDRGELGTEHAARGRRRVSTTVTVAAGGACGGGDLEPDPAGADDQQALGEPGA